MDRPFFPDCLCCRQGAKVGVEVEGQDDFMTVLLEVGPRFLYNLACEEHQCASAEWVKPFVPCPDVSRFSMRVVKPSWLRRR